MARLRSLPRDSLQRDLPNRDKIKLALEFLHENPSETPTTAARLFHLEKEDSVRKAWLRARIKGSNKKRKLSGGHNKILRPDQHQAMIRYAADQSTKWGQRANEADDVQLRNVAPRSRG